MGLRAKCPSCPLAALFRPFGGLLSRAIFRLHSNSDVGLCKQLNREIDLAAGSVAEWTVPTRPSLADELVGKLDNVQGLLLEATETILTSWSNLNRSSSSPS